MATSTIALRIGSTAQIPFSHPKIQPITEHTDIMVLSSLDESLVQPQKSTPTKSEYDSDVCALLMGHNSHNDQHYHPTTSSISCSLTSYDVALPEQTTNENESTSHLPIAKHGFVIAPIETSVIHSVPTTTATIEVYTEPTRSIDDGISSGMEPIMPVQRRPRSGSEGLDYLAYLAEQERRVVLTNDNVTMMQSSEQQQQLLQQPIVTPPTTVVPSNPQSATTTSSSSDSDDSEMMPPPQPRRPRSISNPDDMIQSIHQQHFVLPPHLLRKELLEARGAVVRKAAAEIFQNSRYSHSDDDNYRSSPTIPEHSVYVQEYQANDYDYYSSRNNHDDICEQDEHHLESGDEYDDDDDNDEVDVIIDEVHADTNNGNNSTMQGENISSIELLRRARSRLLEDILSESNTTNMNNNSDNKSIILLPHTLSKYKMVRKNGYCT
jgi:hypothetical protein